MVGQCCAGGRVAIRVHEVSCVDTSNLHCVCVSYRQVYLNKAESEEEKDQQPFGKMGKRSEQSSQKKNCKWPFAYKTVFNSTPGKRDTHESPTESLSCHTGKMDMFVRLVGIMKSYDPVGGEFGIMGQKYICIFPFDPANPLLGIYPKDWQIDKT